MLHSEKLAFYLDKRKVHEFNYFDSPPTEILGVIFPYVPNLKYWSEDAVRNLFIGTLEMVEEYCKEVDDLINSEIKTLHGIRKENAKKLQTRIKSFSRKAKNFIQLAPKLTGEQILKQIYNVILSCEGKGTLPHFGMANKFGDRVYGNPEKQTIRG